MNHQHLQTALTKKVARPPAPPEKLLLNAAESAELIGISLSTFHRLRPRMPAPLAFGPKCVRWRRGDLLKWVQSTTSVGSIKFSGAIRAAGYDFGGGSPAESNADTAQNEERRGLCQPDDPSNPGEAAQQ